MERGTIKRLRPILTIRLVEVTTKGDVGKDVRITINVKLPDSKEIKTGLKPESKCLYQRPVDYNIASVEIVAQVVEKDPKIPDISSLTTYPIKIRTGKLPRQDECKFTVLVKGKDGNLGVRHAEYTLHLKWWLTDNANDFCNFIIEEIEHNLQSETAKLLMSLDIDKTTEKMVNEKFGFLKYTGMNFDDIRKAIRLKLVIWTLIEFGNKVFPKHEWDHKVEINSKIAEKKCGEISLDAEKGFYYNYDLWSNFHFGYIGRALGFDPDTLKKGAAIAQAGSDLYTNADKVYEEIKAILFEISKEDYDKSILKMLNLSKDAFNVAQTIERIYNAKAIEDLDNKGDQPMIKAGIKCYEDVKKTNRTLSEADILDAIRYYRNDYAPIKTKYLINDKGETITEGLPGNDYFVKNNQFYQ